MNLGTKPVSQQREYSKKKMSPVFCRVNIKENLQHGERKNLYTQPQAAQRTFVGVIAMDMPILTVARWPHQEGTRKNKTRLFATGYYSERKNSPALQYPLRINNRVQMET